MALVCRPARDPFPALIGIVVVAFACWTVFCHLLVFTGASFATLLRWCDVLVVLAYWLTDSYLLFWIAAMSFVAVTVFLEQRVGGWAPQWGPSALSPTAWIAIAALAGALLTLISHRPDWDDAM